MVAGLKLYDEKVVLAGFLKEMCCCVTLNFGTSAQHLIRFDHFGLRLLGFGNF